MFKNSLSRKLFGILGAFLTALNSFAWGPWDRGVDLRKKLFPEVKKEPIYKDPLLPFIHPDSRVSVGQFRELIEELSPEQRRDLWKTLKGKEPSYAITPEELEKELRWVSSSWVTFPFNKGSFDYHETVKWVAGKVGVRPEECEKGTTFQLERRIMEKLFAQWWDKLTPEQKNNILKDAGLKPSKVASYSALTASALFAALCSPAGWTLAGTSAVIGLLLLGQPNAMKTAAFIVALHAIKAAALARSGVDISKYILPADPAAR